MDWLRWLLRVRVSHSVRFLILASPSDSVVRAQVIQAGCDEFVASSCKDCSETEISRMRVTCIQGEATVFSPESICAAHENACHSDEQEALCYACDAMASDGNAADAADQITAAVCQNELDTYCAQSEMRDDEACRADYQSDAIDSCIEEQMAVLRPIDLCRGVIGCGAPDVRNMPAPGFADQEFDICSFECQDVFQSSYEVESSNIVYWATCDRTTSFNCDLAEGGCSLEDYAKRMATCYDDQFSKSPAMLCQNVWRCEDMSGMETGNVPDSVLCASDDKLAEAACNKFNVQVRQMVGGASGKRVARTRAAVAGKRALFKPASVSAQARRAKNMARFQNAKARSLRLPARKIAAKTLSSSKLSMRGAAKFRAFVQRSRAGASNKIGAIARFVAGRGGAAARAPRK